jgi:hypothetical protein
VGQWISEICEKSTKKLVGLNKPFKYVITCVIMQVKEKKIFADFELSRSITKKITESSQNQPDFQLSDIIILWMDSLFFFFQRNGAGLHSASSCFWDSANDGSCSFRNPFIHTTLFKRNFSFLSICSRLVMVYKNDEMPLLFWAATELPLLFSSCFFYSGWKKRACIA